MVTQLPPIHDEPASSAAAASPTPAESDPQVPIEGQQAQPSSTQLPVLIVTEDTALSDLTPAQLHELTQNMLDEAASTKPLLEIVSPISLLREEYERGSGHFVKQIDYLESQGYSGVRRTRGDGDCFYRSFAFAYIERALKSDDNTLAVASMLSTLDSLIPVLEAAGFQRLVFEDWYEVLVSLIRQIVVPEPDDTPNGALLTSDILLEAFQSVEVSNCLVVFLRLVTSAQIRMDPDTYAPFLFHPETGEELTPQEFCEREVEAVGKEADHVQITALSQALKTNVSVAYLDGRNADGTVNFVHFHNLAPETFDNTPVLLYRPGHYDILERK